MPVEITMITVGLKRFVCGIGTAAMDYHTVAVMDPKPVVSKFIDPAVCKIAVYRTKVKKNSRFHKEAMSNSAAGKIDWQTAGLQYNKGTEFGWDVEKMVWIHQDFSYAVVDDD